MSANNSSDYQSENDLIQESCAIADFILIFTKNSKIVTGDSRVLLYRGQPKKGCEVTPTLFRSSLLAKEHEIIDELLLRAPDDFINTSSAFERLVKMRHYGLPTRLLDVTTNPLVALYFACVSDAEEDGEVVVLCENLEQPDSIDVKRIAALASYQSSSETQMITFLQDRDLLPKNKEEEYTRTELHNTRSRIYIAVAPPMNNERIKRQQGAFLIMGLPIFEGQDPSGKYPFDIRPYLSKGDDDFLEWSIPVKKELKPLIKQELDVIGINHGFLFPELEHQAEYICEKYEV